jgi:hypothetical protein
MAYAGRTSRSCLLGFVVVIAMASAGCGKRATSKKAPSATTSGPQAAAAATGSARVRRKVADLKPPPTTPPADAQPVPGGGSWKLVRKGTGPGPTGDQHLLGELTIWNAEGKLALSSHQSVQPARFGLDSAPAGTHGILSGLGPGSQATFWLPDAVLSGWRPPSFPKGDLIFELEVREIVEAPPATEALPGATPPVTAQAFPPPDTAGPPKEALLSKSGLKYVVLHRAEGAASAGPDARFKIRFDSWSIEGLMVRPGVRAQATTTTPSRAPGGIGDVIRQLTPGSTARIWIPKNRAAAIIPGAGSHELVLDVHLDGIEP